MSHTKVKKKLEMTNDFLNTVKNYMFQFVINFHHPHVNGHIDSLTSFFAFFMKIFSNFSLRPIKLLRNWKNASNKILILNKYTSLQKSNVSKDYPFNMKQFLQRK